LAPESRLPKAARARIEATDTVRNRTAGKIGEATVEGAGRTSRRTR
jgi:hypothetical protein